MKELQTFKIRFLNENVLSVAIVLAEEYEKAKDMLIQDYKEYGVDIIIEEYEVVTEKGVALTWHEPIPKNI